MEEVLSFLTDNFEPIIQFLERLLSALRAFIAPLMPR